MVQTRRLDRREFIKKSGVTAAGVVTLPTLISSSALGKDGSEAPSERVLIGMIGVGKQGFFLQRAFMNEPNTQIIASSDVDQMKLKRSVDFANKAYADQMSKGSYNGCKGFNDFRELLAIKEIDAVVIATPDHWHAIPAVEAAKAGKDIYCEKPLGFSIEECQAMVKATRRNRRVFQTGSMQRSDSKFRFACELVRNGYIGKIEHVTVNIGDPPKACDLPEEPTPDYLDWDRWLGPAPFRPYNSELSPHISKDVFPNWRLYWDYGGGMTTDWGAHHYDIAQWGLGMDGSGPVEFIPPENLSDKVKMTMKYANGVTMTREGNVNGVLFTGSEGKVEVNRGYLKTWPESLMSVKFKAQDVRLYESNNHYADFLKCMKTREKPICDVEIGHSSATLCHLCNIAYRTKRTIKWDPSRQRITSNDPEAKRLMGRSMRAPWHL